MLSACRDDRQEDFFLSEGRVKIHRYDRLQFEASALNSFTSLQKMNMNFPHATKLLIEDVLALGSVVMTRKSMTVSAHIILILLL